MRLILTAGYFDSHPNGRGESELSLETKEAEYVALSYAWGTLGRPATTTVQNVSQRFLDTKIHQLPKTIRDAVNFVNRIGIKYL